MTGSIQIKRDIYQCVLNYKDSQGHYRQKWFTTNLPVKGNKRKAEAMLAKLMEEYNEGSFTDTAETEFCEYLTRWVEAKKNTIEISTWENYDMSLRKHIIPYFKPLKLKLRDLKCSYFIEYNQYQFTHGRLNGEGGLSVKTIKTHTVVMKSALSEAKMKGIIKDNPAYVPLPKKESTQAEDLNKANFLTVKEANALIKMFDGNRIQPLVYITLYYGLRRSEVLGLKWDAIDFDNNRISIKSTVVRNYTLVRKDKTKSNSSRRSFELIPDVKQMLIKIKAQQSEYRKTFGNTYFESDYVFTWEDGHLYQPDYVTHMFEKQVKKSGIPHIRFHDLRHSCASILYELGWHLKDIQEWLGHSDIKITGNIYTHIDNLRQQNMSKGLNNLFQL